MTISHEPAHWRELPSRRRSSAPTPRPRREPEVSVHYPDRNIRIDTMFWQHRSIFAGTQEQLDELRRDAERKAGLRYHQQLTDMYRTMHREQETQRHQALFAHHHPATAGLKAIIHVGFLPMLWKIVTCECGERWPCHIVKRYLRNRLGWTVDITDDLKDITSRLPKPATRLGLLWRAITRQPR